MHIHPGGTHHLTGSDVRTFSVGQDWTGAAGGRAGVCLVLPAVPAGPGGAAAGGGGGGGGKRRGVPASRPQHMAANRRKVRAIAPRIAPPQHCLFQGESRSKRGRAAQTVGKVDIRCVRGAERADRVLGEDREQRYM